MGSVSTQNVHPLTVNVGTADVIRDPVGHIVNDKRGDREFRFVKFRGGQTASQGMPAFAYKLSADEDTLGDVTVDAASVVNPDRDLAGIVVSKSTAASGDYGWIMSRGRLGKINGSLYPDTIIALVSATVVAGQNLAVSLHGSVYKWALSGSAFAGDSLSHSIQSRVSLLAYSTDVGDKVTRGRFKGAHYAGDFAASGRAPT